MQLLTNVMESMGIREEFREKLFGSALMNYRPRFVKSCGKVVQTNVYWIDLLGSLSLIDMLKVVHFEETQERYVV